MIYNIHMLYMIDFIYNICNIYSEPVLISKMIYFQGSDRLESRLDSALIGQDIS